MSSIARTGRICSRVSCRALATSTLTYIYSEQIAHLGPIAMFSEPHAYDLCERHSARLTVPQGWQVKRDAPVLDAPGPTHDDLMAIADAVREVAATYEGRDRAEVEERVVTPTTLGRRGHLRAVSD